MPAKNESQKRLMCMTIAIKEGKLDAKKFPQADKATKSLTIEQLREHRPEGKQGK